MLTDLNAYDWLFIVSTVWISCWCLQYTPSRCFVSILIHSSLKNDLRKWKLHSIESLIVKFIAFKKNTNDQKHDKIRYIYFLNFRPYWDDVSHSPSLLYSWRNIALDKVLLIRKLWINCLWWLVRDKIKELLL